MKKLLFLVFSVILFAPFLALAAQYQAPVGQDVNVEKETKNLYTAGINVNVNKIVSGDLTVLAQTINIKSDVEQSVYMLGSTINLDADVAQNVKIAGAQINITSKVGQDLIILGQSVNIGSESIINGDLVVVGQNIIIDGKIDGFTKIIGESVTINGDLQSSDIKATKTLTLGPAGIINENLDYKSPVSINIQPGGQVLGETNYNQIKENGSFLDSLKRTSALSRVLGPIGIIIAGIILIYLIPRKSRELVKTSVGNFWKSIGIGILGLILPTVVFGILLVTFIGGWVAMILLTLYALVIMLAIIYGAVVLGSLITKLINKTKKIEVTWKEIVIGEIVLAILAFIPVLGGLVSFVLMILALGAILILMGRGIKAEQAK